MIQAVTGTPGAGKSYYATRIIAAALDSGIPVATNVELRDDAPERIANGNPFRWLIPGRRRRVAEQIRRSLFVSDDLDELFAVQLRGRGENRGLMVIDEAGDELNTRAWNEDGREARITWFRQHRKTGWKVVLIVQDLEMVDKHIRRVVEEHVILRNLRRFRPLGLPVVPFNLFLAIRLWAGTGTGGRIRLGTQCYRLSRRIAGLYNTHQLLHGMDEQLRGVVLPRLDDGTADAAAAAADRPPADPPPADPPAPGVPRIPIPQS